MFTRSFLLGVRSKAIRRGVWYRVLDRVERGIIDLTARVVEKVESSILGVELVKILRKLRDAMKSEFVKQVEEYGICRARVLTQQAVDWGYDGEINWVSDTGFAKYLTAMVMNKNMLFGF